jgi:hypothetical protein
LFFQPAVGPFLLERRQIIQDVQVVDMTIVLEILDPRAGKLGTQAAVEHTSLVGARPDLTPRAAGVDVKYIRAAALARKALQRSSLARRVLQEMLALGERSAIVIAGPTVEAAHGQ